MLKSCNGKSVQHGENKWILKLRHVKPKKNQKEILEIKNTVT